MDICLDIIKALTAKKETLCCAESCTGGMIASALVDVPGASNVFLGGIVAYTDAVKIDVLGVERALIEEHTAVSGFTAEQMARRARKLMKSDWAVAVTGYAGASGIDKSHDGVVYISVAGQNSTKCVKKIYQGERNAVRRQVTIDALTLLKEEIKNKLREE